MQRSLRRKVPSVVLLVFGALASGGCSCGGLLRPPSSPEVVVLPAHPRTDDDLHAVIQRESKDDSGREVTYRYAWSRDGVLQEGISGEQVPAALTRKGERWSVEVTPVTRLAVGTPGSAGAVIENTPPSAAVVFDPAAPSAATGVHAVATGVDADGDVVTFRYAWKRAGKELPEETKERLAGAQLRKGQPVRVTVTPDDGTDEGEPVVLSVSLRNAVPSVEALALSPSPPTCEGPIQLTHAPAQDADGDPVRVTYAWSVDGKPVDGQVGSSLAPGFFKRGQVVEASVTPADNSEKGVPARVSVTVANAPPSFTAVSASPGSAPRDAGFSCNPAGWKDADGDTEGYEFSWSAGGQVISTARVLSGPALVRGLSATCTATPFDGAARGAPRTSAPVTVTNSIPQVLGVAISPQDPRKTDTLKASVAQAVDADGDALTFTYAWFVNGQRVQGATGDTLTGKDFSRGQVAWCTVVASDGRSSSVPVKSPDVKVENTPPALDAVVLTPALPNKGEPLTASAATTHDVDGDAVTVRWAWRVAGAVVPGVTGAALTPDHFVRGQEVEVTAVPSDGTADGMARTARATVADSPPSIATAGITPAAPRHLDELTCVPAGWSDADGDPEGYAYEWALDGIAVANSPVLPAASARRGQAVTCSVQPFDGERLGARVVSEPVVILDTLPVLEAATLSPSAVRTDDTLTASPGNAVDADGDAISFAYAWYVDGAPVDGASGASLDGSHFARGQAVRASVTPSGGTGYGEAVWTPPVTVGNTPPVVSGVSLAPAVPTKAGAIQCSVEAASDADGDALTLRYEWKVGGVAVPGPGTATLGANAFSRGQRVEVSVAASDGSDTGAAVTAAVTVGNSAPSAPAVDWAEPGRAGQALRCAVVAPAADLDGDALTYTFSWTVNGVASEGRAEGASGSLLPVDAFKGGDTVSCAASASDGMDLGGSSSAVTLVVPAATPATREKVVGAAWHVVDLQLPAGSLLVTLGEAPALVQGDEVLVHQAQHPGAAGTYELAFVQSVQGNTVGLAAPLTHAYESAPTAGPRSAQVVKVIRADSLVVPAGEVWRVQPWDGLRGGIMALDVAGTLEIRGRLELEGAGFRGGAPGINGAGCSYPWPTMAGEPGESVTGASALYSPCTRQADKIGHLVPTPPNGAAGGGGAGSGINYWDFSVRSGGGGGGGAHVNDGAAGAGSTNNPNGERGGLGGTRLGLSADADLLILGPGGGGGARGVNANGGWGGHGGGAVLLRAAVVTGPGRISVKGGGGEPGMQGDDGSGGGGGGAGGTLIVKASVSSLAGESFSDPSGGAGGERGSAAESAPVFGYPDYGTGGTGGAGSAGRVVTLAPQQRVVGGWSACVPSAACALSGSWSRSVQTASGTLTETSACAPETAGVPCDDGDPATANDACNGWGRCVGNAFAAADSCAEPRPGASQCPAGMVAIPAGSFQMGRTGGMNTERPTRWISVSAFCMDEDEATVATVRAVLPAAVASQSDAAAAPALLYEDAAEYCRLRGGALPTDAQWEYAARGCAGKATGASAFGLRNMETRGTEWTADWLATRGASQERDPVGPPSGHSRVVRGNNTLTARWGVGPLDVGQLLTENRPRNGVRCAAPVEVRVGPFCGNGMVEAGEACDDGNRSSTDSCTVACQAARCGDGFVQAGRETCDDGNTVGGDGCSAACASEYVLLASLDGSNPAYGYDWSGWTGASSFNAAGDPMSSDLKTPAFAYQPLSAVVVEMQVNGASQHVEIPLGAETLLSVFKGGTRATALGLQAWKQLVPGSSIQTTCTLEGFNLTSSDPNFTGVRLGVVGNGTEPGCLTPDSFIGMGVRRNPCFASFGHTVTSIGNVTACEDQSSYDNGIRDIPARVILWGRPAGALFVPGCGNGVQEVGESCDDGNTVPGDGCSAACVAEGCAWSEVTRYPLDVQPSGALVLNGALPGQGVGTLGGRTAWVQTSDWNQLYVPAGLGEGEDVVAVSTDVWVGSASGWGLGSLNENAAYNDVIKGVGVGYDFQKPELSAFTYAPANNNGICCSSPMVSLFKQQMPAPMAPGQWHRARTELSISRNVVRVLLDGALVQEVRDVTQATWGGRYVSLHGGSGGAWINAQVGYSNVTVERGTPGCVP